jgi:pimeloyl-ACP methyl ester carboxylesterase
MDRQAGQPTEQRPEHVEFGDVEVSYQLRGCGEPLVLIHASPFVSWYDPLVERLGDVATLSYRRRVRAGAGGRHRPLTAAEDAATCARLMDHIGWPVAHVAGHSYGAVVALQLALDSPGRVRTVALLEPAARGVSRSPQAAAEPLAPLVAAYRTGDVEGAVDGFLRLVCGDGYRAVLDRAVPRAFGEGLAEADLFFQAELPAVGQWRFGPVEAGRVTQPVLNVFGTESVPRFVEATELVQSWFPQAERLEVPDVGHLLMVADPETVADGLGAFVARHPVERAQVPQNGPTRPTSRR